MGDYTPVQAGSSGAHRAEGLKPVALSTPPTPRGVRPMFVESVIFVVWIGLEIANVILHVVLIIYGILTAGFSCRTPDDPRPHVVIVGASFGGLAAQRELSGRDDVRVTVIDFKSYFEYTPGVLRCFVQPSYLKQLTCPLPTLRNELLTAAMVGSTEDAVVIRDAQGAKRIVKFDYLVMAVGSTYADPIKPSASEPTLAERQAMWNESSSKCAAASTVIIIGAGPVGVELAGEILTLYPEKKVTLVSNTLLPGFDDYASDYARAWLQKRGAELVQGDRIEQTFPNSLILKSGRELKADVVYKCVGYVPNTAMLKESSVFNGQFGARDAINVNDHLQVKGNPKVYCVGDMMSHSSAELKLAHTAECNAHLAAHNILADIHGHQLLTYPRGVTGSDTTPKLWDVSLGKYDAVMGFNGLIACGWYVAVVKWLLEWTKVAAAAERPIGIWFWKFSDAMANFLHRTLIRDGYPPVKKNGDIEQGSTNGKQGVGLSPRGLRPLTHPAPPPLAL